MNDTPTKNHPALVAQSGAIRIGHGYDLHRLYSDDRPEAGIRLGGVKIDCPWRIEAHSDGDLVVHALIDALLGALALGDIGEYFPDSDPGHRDRDSLTMLNEIESRFIQPAWRINNIDLTVISQVPKLSPSKLSIRTRLARCLKLDTDQVGIKATTAEGMDSIGRCEAIACHCVVLLQASRVP